MRVVPRLPGCLACGLVSLLALAPASAFAEGPMSAGVSAPLVEHPLAMAESQPLLGSQAIAEADEAQRSNPEAVATRRESETKYQNLQEEEAAKLAQELFPATIDDPAGGPPTLTEGQHITGFVNADVAQVELGEGQHGVIESLTPMAIASSDGWSPVNRYRHPWRTTLLAMRFREVGRPRRPSWVLAIRRADSRAGTPRRTDSRKSMPTQSTSIPNSTKQSKALRRKTGISNRRKENTTSNTRMKVDGSGCPTKGAFQQVTGPKSQRKPMATRGSMR